ncbi:MAG: DsbE family thiol:disulfide interchange protein, partial [Mesorhizobium sp.]
MTAGDDIRSDAVPTEVERRTVPRRLVVLLPVTLFAILAGLLAWGLTRNATDIPSALIGKAVPEFSLPPVQG